MVTLAAERSFVGFNLPEQNWSQLPHEFIAALPIFETLAEIKVVLYILRHTWGYREYELPKKITLDEFQYGRKKADGSRIDPGTGMVKNSIKDGLDRAIKHGFISVEVDDKDLARIENYYSCAMIDNSEGQKLTPTIADESEGQTLTPRGSKVDPRTEKETQERKEDSFAKSANASSQGTSFSEFDDPIVGNKHLDNFKAQQTPAIKPALSLVEKAKAQTPIQPPSSIGPSKVNALIPPSPVPQGVSPLPEPLVQRELPPLPKGRRWMYQFDTEQFHVIKDANNVTVTACKRPVGTYGATTLTGRLNDKATVCQDCAVKFEPKQKKVNPIYDAISRMFVRVNPDDAQDDKDVDGLIEALYGKVVRREKKFLNSDQPLTEHWPRMANEIVDLAWWFDRQCQDCARPKSKETFGKWLLQWYNAGKPKRPAGIRVPGDIAPESKPKWDPNCPHKCQRGVLFYRDEDGNSQGKVCDCTKGDAKS